MIAAFCWSIKRTDTRSIYKSSSRCGTTTLLSRIFFQMTEFLGENERSLEFMARHVTGRSLCGSGDRLIDRVTQFLQRRERPHRRLEASSRGAIRHNFIDYPVGIAGDRPVYASDRYDRFRVDSRVRFQLTRFHASTIRYDPWIS